MRSYLALIKFIKSHMYLFAPHLIYHTGSPYIIPYSMENITVCSGQDIVLNATLEFRDSGACMQHIEIAQRILEMNNVHLVTCPTSSSCTIKSERFHVNITETTMVVTISDATQDDSGIYKFFPDTTLSRVTTKFFTVTVSGTYVCV